jgi:hypothetical protein
MFIYMSVFVSAPAPASSEIIYFVFGRFNPPQSGHIDMMIETLRNANGNMVLFLLGNGPRGKLAENPLQSELKQEIIRHHLAAAGYVEGIHYKLIEVDGGRPVGSILHYLIGHDMEMGIDTKSKEHEGGYEGPDFEGRYTLIHAAGKKGPKPGEAPGKNDLEKLIFISDWLSKYNVHIGEPLLIEPVISEKGIPMSASIVRNDANSLTLDAFSEKYGTFYGENTKDVWTNIRKAATSTKTKTQKVARKTQESAKAKTRNKGGNKNKTKKR